MFSAAELLQALLNRRRLRSIRPDADIGFPPSWVAWLASLTERVGAVTGATAESIVAIFMQRELASPPRRAIELNRWQAFGTLWRQHWQPPVRDQRWMRWSAMVLSVLINALFVAMLLYLIYLRFMVISQTEGEQVRVQLVGIGTPEEEGGGPPSPAPDPEPTPTEASPSVSTPDAAQAQRPQLSQEQVDASALDAPAEPQPERDVPRVADIEPAPAAEQPLQVTQFAAPEPVFRLPPPRERAVDAPQAQVVVPQLRSRIVDIPTPRPLAPVPPVQRDAPPREIAVPQITQQPIDVPSPRALPPVRARDLPERATAAPQLQVPSTSAEPRSLPMPAARPASATSAHSATPTDTPAKPSGTPAAATAQARGTQPAATAAGPATSPRPGSAPTTTRADDWGDAKRNVAGQPTGGNKAGAKPGLFNQDGSPRLPPGAPPSGAPPGSVEERIANLDRAGKWLERPGLPYKRSAFEKYWIPHETLLQEWVRKGIKSIAIPIPGTSKKLNCVVSLLQLGGGCGISDPNLNEQPATARPPPDIPFKPELQEDNGSR